VGTANPSAAVYRLRGAVPENAKGKPASRGNE
jgi:hypothetical protein